MKILEHSNAILKEIVKLVFIQESVQLVDKNVVLLLVWIWNEE
jgi:hypothetical protein